MRLSGVTASFGRSVVGGVLALSFVLTGQSSHPSLRDMPPATLSADQLPDSRKGTIVVLDKPYRPANLENAMRRSDLRIVALYQSAPRPGVLVTGGTRITRTFRIYERRFEALHRTLRHSRIYALHVAGSAQKSDFDGLSGRVISRRVLPAGGRAAVVPNSVKGPAIRPIVLGDERRRTPVTRANSRSEPADGKPFLPTDPAPWAPDQGTLEAVELGDFGHISHKFKWSDPDDLSPAMWDGWVYEHNFQLHRDNQPCNPDDHWMTREPVTTMFEWTIPPAAQPYVDTNFGDDPCQMDFTVGVYEAEELTSGAEYAIDVLSPRGEPSASQFELMVEKIPYECESWEPRGVWCVGVVSDARQFYIYFGRSPWCLIPGKYQWTYREGFVQDCYAASVMDEAAAYWPLDENSGTSVQDIGPGQVNGVTSGAIQWGVPGALASPEGSTGIRFGGIHDGIYVPYSPVMEPSYGSLELWTRTLSTGVVQHLAARGGAHGQMILRVDPNGRAGGQAWIAGTKYQLQGDTRVDEGRWHHLILVADGQQLTLYVDGERQATTPAAGTLDFYSGTPLTLGYVSGTSATRLVGDLDAVALYDEPLSEAEVAERYHARLRPRLECESTGFWPYDYANLICADGPIGYWRLDEPSSASGPAVDEVEPSNDGVYDGTASSAPGAVLDGSSNATRFDGIYDGVTIPYQEYGRYSTSLGSVEAWVRPTSVNSEPAYIVSRGAANVPGQLVLRMNSDGTPTGKATIGGVGYEVHSSTPIYGGAWHHLTLTYGSKLRLYVDGEEQGGGTSVSGKLDYFVRSGLDIAQQYNSYSNFRGEIDEVALYDYPLSAAQIQKRWDARDTRQPACSNPGQPGDYRFVICADKPTGYWRMNETSGSEALDATDADNDGTFSGSPILGVEGIAGTAYKFGQPDARVSVPYDEYGRLAPQEGAVEAWIRVAAADAGRPQLFVGRNAPQGQMVMRMNANNKVVGTLLINGQLVHLTSSTTVADASWHYIALSRGNGQAKLFVDGVREAIVDRAGNLDSLPYTPIQLGGTSADTSLQLNGRLDEIAIYDKPLTWDNQREHFLARP